MWEQAVIIIIMLLTKEIISSPLYYRHCAAASCMNIIKGPSANEIHSTKCCSCGSLERMRGWQETRNTKHGLIRVYAEFLVVGVGGGGRSVWLWSALTCYCAYTLEELGGISPSVWHRLCIIIPYSSKFSWSKNFVKLLKIPWKKIFVIKISWSLHFFMITAARRRPCGQFTLSLCPQLHVARILL